MKKSRAKNCKEYDLELRWAPQEQPSRVMEERADTTVRRVEDYLDFLEEFPLRPDNKEPAKVFSEKFVL
jgi:hypothetical protein